MMFVSIVLSLGAVEPWWLTWLVRDHLVLVRVIILRVLRGAVIVVIVVMSVSPKTDKT